MNTSLTKSKVVSRTTHQVVANFTNGFAQNVIELDDGTVLYISLGGDSVEIVRTTPLVDPAVEVPAIVNATDEQSIHYGTRQDAVNNYAWAIGTRNGEEVHVTAQAPRSMSYEYLLDDMADQIDWLTRDQVASELGINL